MGCLHMTSNRDPSEWLYKILKNQIKVLSQQRPKENVLIWRWLQSWPVFRWTSVASHVNDVKNLVKFFRPLILKEKEVIWKSWYLRPRINQNPCCISAYRHNPQWSRFWKLLNVSEFAVKNSIQIFRLLPICCLTAGGDYLQENCILMAGKLLSVR